MQTLRRSRRLARFIAAWFLLWVGAMLVAPAVAAPGLELVCAGSAFKLVPQDGGPAAQLAGQHAQCPACAHAAAPPPAHAAQAAPLAQAATVRLPAVAADLRQSGSAPPPARGPPRLS